MYTDKNLTCADCGQEFVFTASEQDFYAQRNFTEPRRCAGCRASRKAARNSADGGGGGYAGADSGSSSPVIAAHARCSRPPAATAARTPRSPSARPAANPFIAATASGRCAAPDPPVARPDRRLAVLDLPAMVLRQPSRRPGASRAPGGCRDSWGPSGHSSASAFLLGCVSRDGARTIGRSPHSAREVAPPDGRRLQ